MLIMQGVYILVSEGTWTLKISKIRAGVKASGVLSEGYGPSEAGVLRYLVPSSSDG